MARVLTASGAPYNGEVHGWTYDAIGNRLTNTVNGVPQTYAYFKNGSNPLNGQRLSSDSVNAYSYDANGNNLTRNGTPGNFTFGFDANDRMTSITGSATASYGYDYQGRRTSKTVGGATTTYLYDGLNLIQAAAPTTTAYLFGPGIDEPLATVLAGNVAYVSVDGLGSAHLLSDATGTIDNAYLYDAWGVVRSQSGTLANDFGYTAREFAEAGLWFYRARYYQAGVGRFGQEDPVRKSRGSTAALLRLFRYSQAPTQFSDPMGLRVLDPSCKCPPFAPPGNLQGPGMPNMVNDLASACGYLSKPQCSRYLSANYPPWFVDCMNGRCRADDKTVIKCEEDPNHNCGDTPLGGGGTSFIFGTFTPACPAGSGRGFGPTIFHENMRSCGVMTDPNQDVKFYNADAICAGWGTPYMGAE
jgi:RHS repeat-associated protein